MLCSNLCKQCFYISTPILICKLLSKCKETPKMTSFQQKKVKSLHKYCRATTGTSFTLRAEIFAQEICVEKIFTEFIFAILLQNCKIRICKVFQVGTNRKNKFCKISLQWLNPEKTLQKDLSFLNFSKLLLKFVFLPSYCEIFSYIPFCASKAPAILPEKLLITLFVVGLKKQKVLRGQMTNVYNKCQPKYIYFKLL